MAELAELELALNARRAHAELGRFLRSLQAAGPLADVTATRVNRATMSMGAGFGRLRNIIALTFGAAVFRNGIRTIADFQTAMSGVEAVTRANAEQMDVLTVAARKMGAETVFSATEAAQGMEFLGMAGFNTEEIIGSLEGTLALAAAGSLDLAAAADIASNILAGFNLPAERMGEVADVLAVAAASSNTNVRQLGDAFKFVAPIATALNTDIRDTAAGIGVLSNAGIQGGEAGTILRRVMLSLIDPSREAEEALARYGLSLDDVNIKAHGFVPVLQRLTDATLSTADATKIFEVRGVSGFEALTAAVRRGEFSELRAELEDVEGAARRMAETKLDNLSGDFRILKSVVQELTLQTGDAGLAGGLRSLVQTATEGVQFLNENFDALKITAMIVWDTIATAGENSILAVVSAFKGLVDTGAAAGNFLRATFEAVAASIQAAFQLAINSVIDRIEVMLDAVRLAAGVIPGIGADVVGKIDAAQDRLQSFRQDVVNPAEVFRQGMARGAEGAAQRDQALALFAEAFTDSQQERAAGIREALANATVGPMPSMDELRERAAAIGGEGGALGGAPPVGEVAQGFDVNMVNRFETVGESVDTLRERAEALQAQVNDPDFLKGASVDQLAAKFEELQAINSEVERQLVTGALHIGEAYEIGFNRAIASFGTFEERISVVAETTARSLEENITDGLMGIIDGTMSVEEAFANMANAIIQDLIRVMIQQLLVRSLMTALGGAGGGGGIIFHEGGTVGEGGGQGFKRTSANAFVGAGHFQGGGLAGNEVPIVAHRGEEILTEEQQAADEGGGKNPVQIINVTDPRQISEYLAANPSAVLNVINSRRTQVRRILGVNAAG